MKVRQRLAAALRIFTLTKTGKRDIIRKKFLKNLRIFSDPVKNRFVPVHIFFICGG